MSSDAQPEVTDLLIAWSNGDPTALDRLMPLAYDELHRLARRSMRREPADHTLQTTALVNEAYLRLVDQRRVQWQNRAHFFAISAQLMRRILVSMARARHAHKRGSGALNVPLDDALVISKDRAAELVALDDALVELARLDPRRSQVVELRYFGGLSVKETAEVLKLSEETVMRDWSRAKAWLHLQLDETGDPDILRQ